MENKTVVLNGERMNYDNKLDMSILSENLTQFDSTPEELILKRVQGQNIVVTKEMPVSGEIISKFPDSVKLICEAGTGYNNIDLEAAKKKGITVCNISCLQHSKGCSYSNNFHIKLKLFYANSTVNACNEK